MRVSSDLPQITVPLHKLELLARELAV